eukprot:scaffold274026_cov17-Tisochrysis_lutea.AAC.1
MASIDMVVKNENGVVVMMCMNNHVVGVHAPQRSWRLIGCVEKLNPGESSILVPHHHAVCSSPPPAAASTVCSLQVQQLSDANGTLRIDEVYEGVDYSAPLLPPFLELSDELEPVTVKLKQSFKAAGMR